MIKSGHFTEDVDGVWSAAMFVFSVNDFCVLVPISRATVDTVSQYPVVIIIIMVINLFVISWMADTKVPATDLLTVFLTMGSDCTTSVF